VLATAGTIVTFAATSSLAIPRIHGTVTRIDSKHGKSMIHREIHPVLKMRTQSH
jgi:hypothetical protein